TSAWDRGWCCGKCASSPDIHPGRRGRARADLRRRLWVPSSCGFYRWLRWRALAVGCCLTARRRPGSGSVTVTASPYDEPLSALRERVENLATWLAIWEHRAEPDAAPVAAPVTLWTRQTPRWASCTASALSS